MQTQTHANSLPKRKERGSQHGERCPHKDLPHKIPRDRLYSDPTGAQPSSPLGNFYRRIKVCSMYGFFYMCVCRGRKSDPESSIPHYITKNEFMYNIQWRVQEFVRRGGGENQKNNFFCLLLFQVGVGGSSENSRENDISD